MLRHSFWLFGEPPGIIGLEFSFFQVHPVTVDRGGFSLVVQADELEKCVRVAGEVEFGGVKYTNGAICKATRFSLKSATDASSSADI